MRRIRTIFYFLPLQLLLLHFRKFQVILLSWVLLFSTINGGFLKSFGADALYGMPEYMGQTNMLSGALLGVAMGVFFMSWNITTFILHTRRVKFLASSAHPFLKYCINNSLLPLAFLLNYLLHTYRFNSTMELMPVSDLILLLTGVLSGLILFLLISFLVFFNVNQRMNRNLSDYQQIPGSVISTASVHGTIRVSYYWDVRLRVRRARPVSHYSAHYMDVVFKRHHFAGLAGMMIAFLFLVTGGFFLDQSFFEAPAAVSYTVFFALLVAVIGALSYFLDTWSLPFMVLIMAVLNVLVSKEVIDFRNKAYGIDYTNRDARPEYNAAQLARLAQPDSAMADKQVVQQVLHRWKNRQPEGKPLLVLLNVSGGGLRSATFTMKMMQVLDSVLKGRLMQRTFLISGASGGMLAATYYRELFRHGRQDSSIHPNDPVHLDRITRDLLNPVFSSMISRDLFAPAQHFSSGRFTYVKDRGYAFEKKLLENSGGILKARLQDFRLAELKGEVPAIIFNNTITRDGRKMMISGLPLRFMMKPAAAINDTSVQSDAVDFRSMFTNVYPDEIGLLTILRMNATFPYVLPNVWLPSKPIIDVMDAGIRDNYGQETSLRFIDHYRNWILENTSGIVLIQLRDRGTDNWQQPLESGDLTDVWVKPAAMLQHNWFKMQDYIQNDQFYYLRDMSGLKLHRFTFSYTPSAEDKKAAMNFHVTAAEKREVIRSCFNPQNQMQLRKLKQLLNGN